MSNYIHYKDYIGSVEFSEEDEVFHGKLIGIKDLISFEGDSTKTLINDFHNAVDEYLEFCEKNGRVADKPYKGSFNVRVGPELHRNAALYAAEHNQSLNAFIAEAIKTKIQQQ